VKKFVLLLFGFFGFAFAGNVFGVDVTLDTAPVITMAGVVISAIASIWAVKKVISLGNKS